ncbi:hypothetical protein HWQ46_14730 [Shewanella sp. D64]|uniref:hypothetical protein n=1 Tax=unclassified Shewanella TaxID=196818 RepID=UPI0022BA47A4|nr:MULTISPECIES: hypothetical protein [unclassified Shewanella]MEC4726807.1 hypothetical protein [Shewanella sp. D64]MEC4739081.1 hypothetical protein [Shewanella sp. E94]WBJ95937.1 hypothetical protein HWQ47_02025 [Shewanella sp. MTB7]
MASRLTVPQAIRQLFGIDVATQSQLLKTKADSLVRNKLIKIETEQKVQRKTKYLAPGQMTVLFNALLLNAVFHDPKDVKRIFEDKSYREECAKAVRVMFGESNSLMGIALSNGLALKFADSLAGDFDLYSDKLPNPFAVLPQLALGKNQSLLHALLAQSATLEPSDNILLAYLQGDLDRAVEMSSLMTTDNEAVNQLKLHVERSRREAVEFDDLLDQFRKM